MLNHPEFGAAEALDIAIAQLETIAAETDTASPEGWRVRGAIDTLTAIRVQKGCDHFDSACDGTLPSLIDVIVFG